MASFLLFAVDFDGLVGELGSAWATCLVDIPGHLVTGDVHHPKSLQNLLGAGVVMGCDIVLQLLYQGLSFGRIGCGGANGTHPGENGHQPVTGRLLLDRGLAGSFLLEFFVSIGAAPATLGFGGILFLLAMVKSGKIHRYHSCFLNLAGMGNEFFQLLCPQFQQPDLILQGLFRVKGRIVQKFPNLLQREFQFPEEENGVEPLQGFFVIEAVPGFCDLCRFQKANLVVVVQCPELTPVSLLTCCTVFIPFPPS